MRDFIRLLRRTLREALGDDADLVLASLGESLFTRRYAGLVDTYGLPRDPRTPAPPSLSRGCTRSSSRRGGPRSCAEFGLSYELTTTIPKHGGDHCRVDLRPLRRSRSGVTVA